MKKILLFLMSITLLFVITGCKGKKALTADEFKKSTPKTKAAIEIKENVLLSTKEYIEKSATETLFLFKTCHFHLYGVHGRYAKIRDVRRCVFFRA